jgi:hypothetical protein
MNFGKNAGCRMNYEEGNEIPGMGYQVVDSLLLRPFTRKPYPAFR